MDCFPVCFSLISPSFICWIFSACWVIPLINDFVKCKWWNQFSLRPWLACQDTLFVAGVSGADWYFWCISRRVVSLFLCEKAISMRYRWRASDVKTSFCSHALPSQANPEYAPGQEAELEFGRDHNPSLSSSCVLLVKLRKPHAARHHVF